MKTPLISTVAALIASACATPSQMAVDEEVKRLCAVDGGIKVYETVRLPSDKFNQWSQVNFYIPGNGENSLGSEYIFKREIQELANAKGHSSHELTALRIYYSVIRKSDEKVLGEAISYGRGGGDIPGPWHPSTFHCPPHPEAGNEALFKKIYIPLM